LNAFVEDLYNQGALS